MAVIEIDPRAGIGEHVTGRDIAVRKLVTKAGKRIMKENLADDMFETARHAAEVTAAMRSLDARVQSIMTTPYKGRIEVSKHNQKVAIGDRVISRPIARLDTSLVPSLQESGYVPFSPLSASEAAQQDYERRTTPEQRKHDAKMAAARAVGRGEVGGIAMANRLAEAQAHEIRLEAARDEAQRTGEKPAREREKEKTGFQQIPDIPGITPTESKQSSRYNKQASKNTAAGIREAFGGKDLKFLRAMLWTGTAARMVRSIIAMNLQAAQGAAATSYTASAVGSDFRTLRTMGNVARIFGGNEKDAASLLAMLTKHTSGALVGAGLGPLGVAAMRYGLDVTGSGPGGLDTPKGLLLKIADLLKSYEDMPGMVAMIASDIGLSPAILEAMKEGSEVFEKKLSEQTTISQIQLDALKASAQAQGELSNAWKTWKESWAGGMTPIIKAAEKFINATTLPGVSDYEHERRKLLTKIRGGEGDFDVVYRDESKMLEYFRGMRALGYSEEDIEKNEPWLNRRRFEKAKPILRAEDYTKYWTPGIGSQILQGTSVQPILNIDFNFGDLKLTPEQKEEGRKAVGPWLENVIQSTWGL